MASYKIRNWIKDNFTSFPVFDDISELLLDGIHTLYDGKVALEENDEGIKLSIYIDANESYTKKGGIQNETLAEGIAVILDKIFQTRNDIIDKIKISAPAVTTYVVKGAMDSADEAEQRMLDALEKVRSDRLFDLIPEYKR